MRPGLLSELAALGYEILPEGENIKLRYLGQGIPPEAARSLITELKKHKVEALNLLKRRPPVEVWKNPHKQGTPKARRGSLRVAMEANLHQAMADVQASGRWKATPEVRKLEAAMDATYVKVIVGQSNLQDFISLVSQWKIAGIRATCQGRADA